MMKAKDYAESLANLKNLSETIQEQQPKFDTSTGGARVSGDGYLRFHRESLFFPDDAVKLARWILEVFA